MCRTKSTVLVSGVWQRLYADFAVCVACRAHAVLNLTQNGGHLLTSVPFAGLHGQQFFQFGFGDFVGVAFRWRLCPTETSASMDGDFDGLLGFVFVGLDVGIEDTEIEVAVVLVEVGYFFHVLGKFLLPLNWLLRVSHVQMLPVSDICRIRLRSE